MLCRICMVQIQPRDLVLHRAGYTVTTRWHELDRADHTDQQHICPEIYICIYTYIYIYFFIFIFLNLHHEAGIDDDLFDLWNKLFAETNFTSSTRHGKRAKSVLKSHIGHWYKVDRNNRWTTRARQKKGKGHARSLTGYNETKTVG